MIRLLLYRVLPLGTAIAIFSSALSPLRPALQAFGKAASALAGNTRVGGVEAQAPNLEAEAKQLATGPAPSAPTRGKTLQQLAESLRAEVVSDDPFGEQAGARAPKPIAPAN